MSLVSKGLTLQSIDRAERTVSFVASTDAIDSYDEVVAQNWRLERYRANPVVLFGHDSRSLPVAKATRVEVTTADARKQLEISAKFATAEANPVAEQVWQSLLQGTLRAVSVGFRPHDVRLEKRDGRDIYVLDDNELHEISVVPIPANPEALAKMKAKAIAAAGHETPPAPAATEISMLTEKEVTERIAKADAERGLAEKQLADAQKELTTAKAALAASEGTVKALEADRDAQRARAEKAETALVEGEVEALVGKKIAPAEKADFVELARANRPLFERMVKARPEMKLLSGQVIPDEKGAAPPSPTTGSRGNGEALAAKIFGTG